MINNEKIYIDDLNIDELKDIGVLCANFGFNISDSKFLLSKPLDNNKKDFREDSKKQNYVKLVALKNIEEIYSSGHKTVFDLMHHYYVSSGFFDEGTYDMPAPNKIILDHTAHFAKLTKEIVEKSPLQAFYTHHIFQRYICSACFELFDNEYTKRSDLEKYNNFPEIMDTILNTQDLYTIANFTLYSESEFFRNHDYFLKFCKKKVKGMPKKDTILTYSQETNGIEHDKVRVPLTTEVLRIKTELKNKKYAPEVFFPDLFSKDQIKEVFQNNPLERSYLINSYPEMFSLKDKENIKEAMSSKTKFLKENYLDYLLEHGNYCQHFQTKMLPTKN